MSDWADERVRFYLADDEEKQAIAGMLREAHAAGFRAGIEAAAAVCGDSWWNAPSAPLLQQRIRALTPPKPDGVG